MGATSRGALAAAGAPHSIPPLRLRSGPSLNRFLNVPQDRTDRLTVGLTLNVWDQPGSSREPFTGTGRRDPTGCSLHPSYLSLPPPHIIVRGPVRQQRMQIVYSPGTASRLRVQPRRSKPKKTFFFLCQSGGMFLLQEK